MLAFSEDTAHFLPDLISQQSLAPKPTDDGRCDEIGDATSPAIIYETEPFRPTRVLLRPSRYQASALTRAAVLCSKSLSAAAFTIRDMV